MTLNNRQIKLIVLLVLLLSLKFILIPFFTWQESQINSIKLEQKKLTKYEQIIQNRERLESLIEAFKDENEKISALFFSLESESKLKLELQQIIESDLLSATLRLNSIGWKGYIGNKGAVDSFYDLEFSFSGSTENALTFFVSLNEKQEWFRIKDIYLDIDNQRNKYLGTIEGRVVLGVFVNEI